MTPAGNFRRVFFIVLHLISRRDAMRITENIHAIKLPFQVVIGPETKLDRFVYAYLVLGPEIALIDSAVQKIRSWIPWNFVPEL